VEDRISELEDKIEIKEKQKKSQSNNARAVKGICKNSVTPSKDKPENYGIEEGEEEQAK
jgi:hypothetical protein